MSDQRDCFIDHVLRNTNNRVILDRVPGLELPDWWLTAGALFQTVWNVLDGREPATGIDDYDLFYFDASDLSSEAEEVVIERVGELFADLGVVVEVRNEARVHLWYEEDFGVPAKAFESSRDAIDHFASATCCYAVTRNSAGKLDVYAPHGYDDLFNQRLRPNPVLAPRHVYERKAARWTREWPSLSVAPWPQASIRTDARRSGLASAGESISATTLNVEYQRGPSRCPRREPAPDSGAAWT